MSSHLQRWSMGVVLSFGLAMSGEAALSECTTIAQKWVPCEITKFASNQAPNPFRAMDVKAVVTPPAGVTFNKELRAYWVGGTQFKFRFTPTAAGAWSYRVYSPTHPTAFPNVTETINVGAAPAGKKGFLRRSATNTGRVVFDNGEFPFLFGQTYYQAVTNARATGDAGDWKNAMSNSKNLYKMNKVRLLVYPWLGENSGRFGGVYVETQPFGGIRANCNVSPATTKLCPEYNTLDFEHFTALDRVIEHAYNLDMIAEIIVFKDPAIERGTRNVLDNWRTFGEFVDQDQRYAKYLLARYGAYPNVTFSMANEWQNAEFEPIVPVVHDPAYYNNSIASLFRDEDPYFQNGSNLRLLTIHSKTALAPDPNFAKATVASGVVSGWMTHASLQYGPRGNDPTIPDKWGADIRAANGNGTLVFNDEYGYVGESIFTPGSTTGRIDHRRAIWGLTTAAIYATAGDFTGGTDNAPISIRADWKNQPGFYDDIRNLIDVFTATNRNVTITNFQGMGRRTDVFNNATRRVWAMGFAASSASGNQQFVIYDAIGTGTFTITLPSPAGRSYRIWYYDPSAPPASNTYPLVGTFGTGATTPVSVNIAVPAGRGGLDTVYLVKLQ